MHSLFSRESGTIPPMPCPIYAAVMEGKGGVGKSTCSMTTHHALALDESTVAVYETDGTNATMAAIGLTTSPPISTRDVHFTGGLLEGVDDLAQGLRNHVLVDTGARDDAEIMPELWKIKRHLDAIGARLVVIRPLTTNIFVQNHAIDCAERLRGFGIGMVLVTALWGGRTRKDYADWENSAERHKLLTMGVVETNIESIGVVIADNLVSLGLSAHDVATGAFEKAGDYEEMARKVFTRARILYVNEWLDEHTVKFREAIARAAMNPL